MCPCPQHASTQDFIPSRTPMLPMEGEKGGRKRREKVGRKESRKQREGMQMRAGGGSWRGMGVGQGKTKAVHTVHCSGHLNAKAALLPPQPFLPPRGRMEWILLLSHLLPSRSITHFQISMPSLPCRTISSLSQSVPGLLPYSMASLCTWERRGHNSGPSSPCGPTLLFPNL